MERSFPPKTLALVANTLGTITWRAADIAPRFNESIIKKNVSIRFSCATTSTSSVNCGVRYDTITKTYQVAERKTLFVIPAGGSVEITPQSKPALGLLYEWITNIYLDLTSASAGTVTVTLIVDDDPPTLTADPGELIGLDARLNEDYLIIMQQAVTNVAAFANTTIGPIYTVPAGKRFFIDLLHYELPPSASYPDTCTIQAQMTINGVAFNLSVYSSVERTEVGNLLKGFSTPLAAGDTITAFFNNQSATLRGFVLMVLGREVF